MKALWLSCAVMTASGCGLIDSDITDFDLSLPEREVSFDTADWMLSDGGANDGALPEVSCSGMPTVCGTAMAEFCAAEDVCSGSCNAAETCDVNVAVALWNTFELGRERPELEQIEGQPLVSVKIRRVYFSVTENTLTTDSPVMTVYVGPETVMSPSDPGAQAVGIIPSVAAGTTVTDRDVELTASGEDILADFMKDYETPFNLIVGADVVVGAGDTLPSGKMVAVVKATASAGL